MKFTRILLAFSLILTSSLFSQGIYQTELEQFEKSTERTKLMFSDEAPLGLSKINKDIEIYKHLTPAQRMIRFVFLGFDPVIVTLENMPQLYTYISNLCKTNNIEMPTVFIAPTKGFFNAAAQKLFVSTGAIIIGKELIEKVNDAQLEAIVAHEIGHIKHNHVNKLLGLTFASMFAVHMAKKYFRKPVFYRTQNEATFHSLLDGYMTSVYAGIITAFIVNKKFEKEADQFACENDKAEGIAEFFEYLQEKEHQKDKDFDITYDALQDSKSSLEFGDVLNLKMLYYLSKGVHLLDKGFRWIYHYTPYGAHPAPEYRVAAAQDYLKQTESIESNLDQQDQMIGQVENIPLDGSDISNKN